MKPTYQKIFEQAKPFLQTRKNLIHAKISLQYALKLLETEGGDEEVVVPAIILHDVGWKSVPEKLQVTAFGPYRSNPPVRRLHELEGEKRARKILEVLRYPPKEIDEICRIIRGHDSRKRPVSRSDRIVKDADKLFRYSREGVAMNLSLFPIPREDYLDYLEKQIGRWFFLNPSRQWAREELSRRRKETKGSN